MESSRDLNGQVHAIYHFDKMGFMFLGFLLVFNWIQLAKMVAMSSELTKTLGFVVERMASIPSLFWHRWDKCDPSANLFQRSGLEDNVLQCLASLVASMGLVYCLRMFNIFVAVFGPTVCEYVLI